MPFLADRPKRGAISLFVNFRQTDPSRTPARTWDWDAESTINFVPPLRNPLHFFSINSHLASSYAQNLSLRVPHQGRAGPLAPDPGPHLIFSPWGVFWCTFWEHDCSTPGQRLSADPASAPGPGARAPPRHSKIWNPTTPEGRPPDLQSAPQAKKLIPRKYTERVRRPNCKHLKPWQMQRCTNPPASDYAPFTLIRTRCAATGPRAPPGPHQAVRHAAA